MYKSTEKGELQYGIMKDGVWHKAFTMRPATLEDVECAVEEAGEDSCSARIKRHIWARTLTELGTLPQASITAETLAHLEATEYGILDAAEQALRKKLLAASTVTAGACS